MKTIDDAIQKLEYIMEGDPRTFSNPECEYGWIFHRVNETIEMLKEIEKNLLSEQPEQRWIPCNKRLPKGRELVNVSCHDDSGDTSYDYSSCGWVTDDGEYWIVDNDINSFVVAWMPLPEPYKGEEDG